MKGIHGEYDVYSKYIKDILKNPNYVLEDIKNEDTIIMLKQIQDKGKNIQLVIKLSTGKDKNSILTLWKVRNSTYQQLIRNKKIPYKDE